MKEISFNTLHKLVAKIDPVWDSVGFPTSPIFFSVINGKEKNYFAADFTFFHREELGDYPDFDDSEFYKDEYATKEEENNAYTEYFRKYPMAKLEDIYLQILVSYENYYGDERKVLDTQSEEEMSYEQIGEMLKEKCNINETSKIILYEHKSFKKYCSRIGCEEALDTYYPNI